MPLIEHLMTLPVPQATREALALKFALAPAQCALLRDTFHFVQLTVCLNTETGQVVLSPTHPIAHA